MTERKPVGMSFDSFVDQQVSAAQRDGSFDQLEGQGKPIPGSGSTYDPDWWIKDLMKREELNVLPAALQLKLDIQKKCAEIAALSSRDLQREQLHDLNKFIAQSNSKITSGPASDISGIDIDQFLLAHPPVASPESPDTLLTENSSNSRSNNYGIQLLKIVALILVVWATIELLIK